MNVRRAVVPVILVTFAVTACAGDDSSAVTDATSAAATSGPTAAKPLTGTQICERLTVAEVTANTGLDVTLATPDDTATPQCRYDFVNSTGGISNLTVASMRPEDVGGLSGTAAFDSVVRINRSVAGDDAEVQELSAGEAAVRLTSPSFYAGVVLTGNHVLTVIVPADDNIDTDAVDTLIATIATALG